MPESDAADRSTPVSTFATPQALIQKIRYRWRLLHGDVSWYSSKRRWAGLVRSVIAVVVFGHESELCHYCGRRYNDIGQWWSPEPLWMELQGRYGGTMCPRCFTQKAHAAGYVISWTPMVTRHNGVATTNHWCNPVRDRLMMGEPDPHYFDGEKVNEPQGHWGTIGITLGWDLRSQYPPENVA